jgi:hypothetical protein
VALGGSLYRRGTPRSSAIVASLLVDHGAALGRVDIVSTPGPTDRLLALVALGGARVAPPKLSCWVDIVSTPQPPVLADRVAVAVHGVLLVGGDLLVAPLSVVSAGGHRVNTSTPRSRRVDV